MLAVRRIRLFTSSAAALAVASTLLTPPAADAVGVRIYPLGDSITWGTALRYGGAVPADPVTKEQIVASPGGYRAPLSALLAASAYPHELVGTNTQNPGPVVASGKTVEQPVLRHNGHRGYRIQDTANALTGRAGNQKNDDLGGYWLTGAGARPPIDPDLVILMIGTNDVGQRVDDGTTYPTADGKANLADPDQRTMFLDHVEERLRGLVDKIQYLRPGAEIVLCTVLPVTVQPLDRAIADYNERVREVAGDEAAQGVTLAEAWGAFATDHGGTIEVTPGLISDDGAHPTPAGYALLATVLRDAVLASGATGPPPVA